jgi:hypothetical protein
MVRGEMAFLVRGLIWFYLDWEEMGWDMPQFGLVRVESKNEEERCGLDADPEI